MAPVKSAKTLMKKVTKKKKKDPAAPKRALSAYMFYVKDKRQEIVTQNPELSKDIGQVGKMIGEAWGKLTPFQKAPYEKKAQQDKARYMKEKEEYIKKNRGD